MNSRYSDLATLLKVLSHPMRLQILDLLRNGELCVCQIQAVLRKRQAYVSQQLMALREAGLVETRKDGLQVFYRLSSPLVETLLTSVLGDKAPVPPSIDYATSYPVTAIAVLDEAV